MMASENRKAAAVKWLVEHGADVNAVNGPGQTALDVESTLPERSDKVIELLMQGGAIAR